MGFEDKNQAVGRLAAKQSGRLRRFLRRRVRNAADIPDIVQEVFLRLLRVPHLETIRTPEAYIFTIARHVALQRQLEAEPLADPQALDDALADLRFFSDRDPMLEVTAEQCLERMEEALRHMAPKVQATFLLYRRDGLSIDEVSERLGISRPMAKKYLSKAFVQFRQRLKEDE